MAQWTDEQRETALGLIRAGGGTNEVSRRTGVPASTLSRWCKDAGIEVAGQAQTAAAHNGQRIAWANRRAALVDDLGDAAADLLTKTLDANDGSDARGWATAMAILVDKAQLLSGGATSRHEQLGLERQRERVRAMQDELAERRAAKDGTTGG